MTTLMSKSSIKDNFDINVWNRGAYESEVLPEDQHYDEWVLCPYSLRWDEDGDICQDQELREFNLVLTEEDAKQLTLGWGTDLGGDYCEDNDCWIDSNSFRVTYKDIPPKVSVWLDFVEARL